VGLMSKSGGMLSEISNVLTSSGIGQSTVVGMGGDKIVGTDFVELLEMYNNDLDTRAIIMFGEIGGTYEEIAAEFIKKESIKKPVVALIAGEFTKDLEEDTVLGHAGAIVSRGRGSFESKVGALRDAGVHIASSVEELPEIVNQLI